MRRGLIGIAIDILKWLNEPLYCLHKAVNRLRDRRIELLVPLQDKHHKLRRQSNESSQRLHN